MSFTNIDDSSAHFQVLTYTGNGTTTNNVTNTGNSNLQPDFVWIKDRSVARDHVVTDSSRDGEVASGTNLVLAPNTNEAEASSTGFGINYATNGINFDASWNKVNGSGETYVAWQWKANGGSTTSVSSSGTGNGCVNACTHQANTTAGISIITYTGRDDQLNNGQHSLLKHGLGVAPTFTMLKRRDATGDWYVMGKEVTSASAYSNNEYLSLNDTDGINGNSYVGSIAPTSTDIYLGNELVNIASATYVMYAFAETQGFSKFGSYIGSGNRSTAPFIYTGFQPAFIMVKDTVSAHGWSMFDNKRIIANGDMHYLAADRTDAESGTGFSHVDPVDFMSNGFRIMNADAWMNTVNRKYIYMAFAQHPFVTSTGIPTTAR